MNNTVSVISSLIIFLYPYVGKHWFNRHLLASTVVSFGLLGTFGGIFWGLLEFNVNSIEESLPQLLEGLKTAFLTSIAGMGSSLLLKLTPAFYAIRKEKETPDQEQEETKLLFSLLSSIEKNTANIHTSEKAESSSQPHLEGLQDTLENINSTLHTLQQTQEDSAGKMTAVLKELQTLLEGLNQTSGQLGTYLNKSVSMSVNQQERIATQMNNLGDLVKNTGTQFEQQMVQMEEKFTRELTAMEQFTKTLLSIIKKLSQDHTALNRPQGNEGQDH